jgi:hypothetical protein
VRLERLGTRMKTVHLIGSRICDLPSCSLQPYPLYNQNVVKIIIVSLHATCLFLLTLDTIFVERPYCKFLYSLPSLNAFLRVNVLYRATRLQIPRGFSSFCGGDVEAGTHPSSLMHNGVVRQLADVSAMTYIRGLWEEMIDTLHDRAGG